MVFGCSRDFAGEHQQGLVGSKLEASNQMVFWRSLTEIGNNIPRSMIQ
jgi:hypothetical protein